MYVILVSWKTEKDTTLGGSKKWKEPTKQERTKTIQIVFGAMTPLQKEN